MKHTRPTSTLLAFTFGFALVACGQAKQATKAPSPEVTVTPSDTPSDKETPGENAASDGLFALNEKAEYRDGIEVSLSNFNRDTSGENASPMNTPYVSFTLTIVNGKTTAMDLEEVVMECMYGDPGQVSREIVDYSPEVRLMSIPTIRLLPGKRVAAKIACEMDPNEKYLQLDFAPDWKSETVTFHGKVK